MADDRMLSDEILLGLIKANSGGGGGGTNNYNDLSNQPQIGGVTLSGDKSASDLGLVAAETGKVLSSNDYTDADKAIVGGVTAALADKQDNLTAGNYITFEDDEISVKRLVLDSDKYTYEIYTKSTQTHVVVDKYNSNSTLVSTREYYMNDLSPAVEVDGLFTLYAYGGPWTCTLLVASKDHAAGYSFSSQWNVYTHYPETFELPPEENPNDLIIRSELSAVSSAVSAIKDGQSIDSFSDVETALSGKQGTLTFDDVPTDGSNNPVKSNGVYDALATKQDKTDNSLQTTDKTIVGAVNELKSGLTNVNDIVGWQKRNIINYPYITPMPVSHDGIVVSDDGTGVLDINGLSQNGYHVVLVGKSGLVWGNISNAVPIFPHDGKYVISNSSSAKLHLKLYRNGGLIGEYSVDNDTQVINVYTTDLVEIAVEITRNLQFDHVKLYPTVIAGEVSTGWNPHHIVIGDAVEELESRIEAVESGLDGVQSGLINKLNVIKKNTGSSTTFTITFPTNGNNVFAFLFGRFGYNQSKLSMAIVSHKDENEAFITCLGDETATVSCIGHVVTVTTSGTYAYVDVVSPESIS